MEKERSFDRTKFLNALGGIPDLLASSIPNFVLEKNRCTRAEYLDQLAFYDVENWPAHTRSFLKLPDSPPAFHITRPDNGSAEGYETVRYPSRYEVANPALADRFAGHTDNLNGYLTLWRCDPNALRPLVLCVHGFMMGKPRRAERMFKVKSLLARGLDVALYIQPFHWKRAPRRLRHLILDPNDVPLTIETLAQSVHDLHSAVLLLREMGYKKIGAIGASLGGYTGALYAAAGPAVDFIFTAVPAIDFFSYLKPRSRGFAFEIDDEIVTRTRRALDVVSPLTYSPNFDVSKMAVVMHGGDRICETRFARQWVEQWKIPNFVEVIGGHWLYLDRSVRGRTWYGWLEKMGYTR